MHCKLLIHFPRLYRSFYFPVFTWTNWILTLCNEQVSPPFLSEKNKKDRRLLIPPRFIQTSMVLVWSQVLLYDPLYVWTVTPQKAAVLQGRRGSEASRLVNMSFDDNGNRLHQSLFIRNRISQVFCLCWLLLQWVGMVERRRAPSGCRSIGEPRQRIGQADAAAARPEVEGRRERHAALCQWPS